jgi:hypothetical protein
MLGFWRVKRWERGILASQTDNSAATPAAPSEGGFSVLSRFENTFGLRGSSRSDLFRQGFGFGRRERTSEDEAEARLAVRVEEGNVHDPEMDALETDAMLRVDPNDPNRSRLIAEVFANERRLQTDLRNAGLL